MLARQTESLEKKILNFLNRIHRRNIREILAAFAVIAIFAFDIAYRVSQHREDNLSLVGGSIIILAMLLNVTIIRWKLHIPKSEISAFPPTQFPGKWKHHLTHQARMLRLVWLWYLLPLFLGISIYLLSVYDKSSISFIILFLFEIAAFIGAWRLNIQAAKQIERDRDTWFGVVG